MKKLMKFIEVIKEKLFDIDSNKLLQFIGGVVITELVFDIISIHSILHYGVAIVSFVISTFCASIVYKFNIKQILRFGFGSIIAVLLICFALI